MGTNSEQALQAFSQGLDMFKEIGGQVSGGESDTAEDQARLLETDAKSDAYDAQRRARQEESRVRAKNEKTRSAANAEWGTSNLAMSGSKAVVRNARSVQDKQEEDDILYEGQRTADDILRQARNRANLLRINAGSSANRSTLSLGSSIYKYGS